MGEQPEANYFAIIPADIRYDEELIPSAKLLYGEITALCKKEGYCWATNEHFAELYKTSEKTITRWIKNLEEKGYIATTVRAFRYKDGTIKKVRYIFLDKNKLDHMDKIVPDHMDKIVPDHMDKNVQNQPDKNVPYNNKRSNSKASNSKVRKFTPPTVKEVTTYCLDRNNRVNPQQFVDFYTSKGWKVGNTPMKDWKAAVRTWEQRDAEKSSATKPKDDDRWYKVEDNGTDDDWPL